MREEQFYKTLIQYIEYIKEEKIMHRCELMVNLNLLKKLSKYEFLTILKLCEIRFNQTEEYTKKNLFLKEYVELRIPIPYMSELENYKDFLDLVCQQIYIPKGNYEYSGLKLLPLSEKIINKDIKTLVDERKIIEPKDIIYNNFKKKAINRNYDKIETLYIVEACECAGNENKLAAATMIGCAAERLLILLSEAYLEYLKTNSESSKEIENFEKKVVNIDKAHKRLDELNKYISNKSKLFENMGFEKHNLHFSFLDIIRQVRNESGHPTGFEIESDNLQSIVANYSLLYDKIHNIIKELSYKIN